MTSGFHVIAAVATDLVRDELKPRLERVVVGNEIDWGGSISVCAGRPARSRW